MAQGSWPSPGHNARAVTDVEYEKVAAHFSDDGIYGTPADDPVVAPGNGLAVNIRAGVYGSLRGHAWTSGATGDTLAIAANASGQTRIDRVVLRLDRSTWTVRAVVKQGTPGGGVPGLSQSTGDTGTYEIALAEVSILSGAGSVTVTRKELYVGSRVRPCTSSTRNPIPATGELLFEVDTGRVVQWTGSGWRIVSDDSGVVNVNSPVSAWEATVDSVLEMRNGVVCLRLGSFRRAAGTLNGTDDSRLPVLIPDRYLHPTRDQYIIGYTTGAEACRMQIYSKASTNTQRRGQLWLVNHPAIGTNEFVLPQSGVSWVVS